MLDTHCRKVEAKTERGRLYLTTQEAKLILRLRQLRNSGADIAIVQLVGDAPRARIVGKVEG